MVFLASVRKVLRGEACGGLWLVGFGGMDGVIHAVLGAHDLGLSEIVNLLCAMGGWGKRGRPWCGVAELGNLR